MKRRTFLKNTAIAGLACLMPQNSLLEDKATQAESAEPKQTSTGFEKYGRVIFSRDPKAQNQLYIIGQKHENPLTGKIDDLTVPLIQTQIYRICEALKRKGVKLIINEGITEERGYQSEIEKIRKEAGGAIDVPEEVNNILEGIFKNPGLFAGQYFAVNNPDIIIRGVDNNSMIDESLKYLTRLPKGLNTKVFDHYCLMRSGLSLAVCPKVAYEEFKKGRIPNLDSIFIIGAAHLDELEEYAKNSRILIPKLKLPGGASTQRINCEFPLEKLDMGVTIILPNAIKNYKKWAVLSLLYYPPEPSFISLKKFS